MSLVTASHASIRRLVSVHGVTYMLKTFSFAFSIASTRDASWLSGMSAFS